MSERDRCLLSELLAALPRSVELPGQDVTVTGISDDSRQVRAGTLFVAVPGVAVDGQRFIPQALEAGAAAIVGERPAEELPLPPDFPYAQVPDAREALGWLHAAWRGFPSRKMTLVGVTGTDGKTTTTNLLYAMLKIAGCDVGMISTVNARIGERVCDTGLHTTTPPSGEVQRYLAEMAAAGMTHAVLEATSHGLAQQRLAGCDFDVAVLTNITHEHLDYHGTLAAYREAKESLFQGLLKSYRKPDAPKVAVFNADDPGSYAYLRSIPVQRQVIYGLGSGAADVTAQDIRFSPAGLHFTLDSPWGRADIRSALVGTFNVSNILAAASAALALGVTPEMAAEAVAAFQGVPGRMERIDAGQPCTAIVDFAHTPNALRRALETARQIIASTGRVIVVFGCAGLRDREKRQLMGEVAAECADLTVITAEDPRAESLAAIMAETAAALSAGGRREGADFWRVPDRGVAILHAVELARPGDVVIACGKGHEQSMCFGVQEYPWDDRRAMRRALRGETLDTLPTARAR
ncbi:MAG: UDP-N-acetylmuramoyl-L-alanyl-D-glutamate--2,6-diaminopimelate ligase [Chloroflexota bacterium]|nr:UDP-N-acetylmuramoyl-L-alanyl-D-glutamate--2,6-diaminopimelate ligase [Chloroflexota bacterium]